MTKLRKELERQERDKHKYLNLYHIRQEDYKWDKERIKKEEAYNRLLKKLDNVKSEKVKTRLIREFVHKYHHREGG
jgi:hypothetical protein